MGPPEVFPWLSAKDFRWQVLSGGRLHSRAWPLSSVFKAHHCQFCSLLLTSYFPPFTSCISVVRSLVVTWGPPRNHRTTFPSQDPSLSATCRGPLAGTVVTGPGCRAWALWGGQGSSFFCLPRRLQALSKHFLSDDCSCFY